MPRATLLAFTNASATPRAIKVALETASSFSGQEGKPLPLLAIKLSAVITNSDVTVPKIGLLSNRTDIHGKIYNRSRRLATATYTATQLVTRAKNFTTKSAVACFLRLGMQRRSKAASGVTRQRTRFEARRAGRDAPAPARARGTVRRRQGAIW